MNTMDVKEYRKIIAGQRSREAGATFENDLAASLEWYEEHGILKAAKTPEPMKVIKRLDGGRFVACFEKKAQVDFSGTLKGGRAIRFEAKQTWGDHFDRKRLSDEQMNDLREHQKLGALCFIVLCFGYKDIYRVPWDVWDNMKATFGRQYVTEIDLQEYKLPYIGGVIKILDGIPLQD